MSIFPGALRGRTVPRLHIYLHDLVQKTRGAISCGAVLQRRFSVWCILRSPSLRHWQHGWRGRIAQLEVRCLLLYSAKAANVVNRWLFILEGIATCLITVISWPLIQDNIQAARWLTTEEKRYLELRLQYDGNENGYKEGPFQFKYVIQSFTDVKVYLGCVSSLQGYASTFP